MRTRGDVRRVRHGQQFYASLYNQSHVFLGISARRSYFEDRRHSIRIFPKRAEARSFLTWLKPQAYEKCEGGSSGKLIKIDPLQPGFPKPEFSSCPTWGKPD